MTHESASHDNSILDRIGERIISFGNKDYPLQKFMNLEKYSSLISQRSLYIACSNRFNDDEEGYLFLQNSIEGIRLIPDVVRDKCIFIDLDESSSPCERVVCLLKQIYRFNHPCYMHNIGGGTFIRPEYDLYYGYVGFRYEDALRVFESDFPAVRKNTYIACFCSNTTISKYMKEEYGDIIIRTSKNRLIGSLHTRENDFVFDSFPVMYLDINDKSSLFFYQDTIYKNNVFGVKRPQYMEEEEFRLSFSRKNIEPDPPDHIFIKVNLEKNDRRNCCVSPGFIW